MRSGIYLTYLFLPISLSHCAFGGGTVFEEVGHLIGQKHTYNVCIHRLPPPAPEDIPHIGMVGRCQNVGTVGHVLDHGSGVTRDSPSGL